MTADAGAWALGQSIQTARKARDLTQRQLAALLDVDQSAVAQWERGRTRPGRTSMGKLADHLGLPLDLLLEVADGHAGQPLHPDAVQLALRASRLDDRTRRALLAAVDTWLAGT